MSAADPVRVVTVPASTIPEVLPSSVFNTDAAIDVSVIVTSVFQISFNSFGRDPSLSSVLIQIESTPCNHEQTNKHIYNVLPEYPKP